MVFIYHPSFFYTFVLNLIKMAKKKNTTKKIIKETPENKAEKFNNVEVKFNGGVIIDGKFYKMGEAKSRQMVKDGKAKLA